jgi:phenylalanyl-tRNA synthetase alpha chain
MEARTDTPPDLIQALDALEAEALEALAAARGRGEVEEVRIRFLGRKDGRISGILRGLGGLPPEARPLVGARANEVRARVESALESVLESARAFAEQAAGDASGGGGAGAGSGPSAGASAGAGGEGDTSAGGASPGRGSAPARGRAPDPAAAATPDLTLPGRSPFVGARHPITLVVDELWDIFRGMGFTRARGPEAETEWYNFEALNTPLDHPAADEQDTLYLKGGNLLRSHTSPVQVRVMEGHRPPIRILAPGMVYRRDTYDATHAPAFLQLEGLVVDEGITFVDLKATLAEFARRYWGPGTRIRFRPSFFPFTEPSAEVDVKRSWTDADGVEHETDWLEIMGAGMVDPAVLESAGIDPERYSGFAFGMGPGRIGMLKYGIPDIRAFFENDVRFLSQFSSPAPR